MKKKLFITIFSTCLCALFIGISIGFTVIYTDFKETPWKTATLWATLAFIVFAAVFAGIAILASVSLSRKISKPVNNIDFDAPEKSRLPKEFNILCQRIDTQNKEMEKRFRSIKSNHDTQDRMRQQFTANVSHELKTPLTSVSGYAELIRDGLVEGENINRFAGKIYDESQRMINLVGDIIKLSQFDEKDINVKIERINLLNLCRTVITGLESLAQKQEVRINLTGDNVEISGAELIVEEIIHNLVKNAVKYNKKGGKVDVSVKQCLDGIELSVSDTGIGIPEEDIEHIFERFYRVDKSHSKDIGGTGLGLSIVKHGAMFHNASLSVESKVDVGTTIRVLF
ncbi:MAG: ATP-binding protein [Clostridia bacterium]|nr:ATP-binding protein [Clostridia bacterium]